MHLNLPIAYCILNSIQMLKNAFDVLTEKCVSTIHANRERCLAQVESSIGIITAFVPILGYEMCASIAKQALAENRLVEDVLRERVPMSSEMLTEFLKPEIMTMPLRKKKNTSDL